MYAVFHFGLYPNANFYSREVYNLFDWLGDIGGLQGSILIFSPIISSFFSAILVPIHKAETIYKYLPLRQKDAGDNTLRSADEKNLENFSRLTNFRVNCLQKFMLIFCCSKYCRSRH